MTIRSTGKQFAAAQSSVRLSRSLFDTRPPPLQYKSLPLSEMGRCLSPILQMQRDVRQPGRAVVECPGYAREGKITPLLSALGPQA